MAQPNQLPGFLSPGVRSSRRLRDLPPEQLNTTMVPPSAQPPGLVVDVTPPTGTMASPAYIGLANAPSPQTGFNITQDLTPEPMRMDRAQDTNQPRRQEYQNNLLQPPQQQPNVQVQHQPQLQQHQIVPPQAEMQQQQMHQNQQMHPNQHPPYSQPLLQGQFPPNEQQQLAYNNHHPLNLNGNHTNDSLASDQSGYNSTISAPQFRSTNAYLHHHGRFYGNIQQAGSEIINLNHATQMHHVQLNELTKDMQKMQRGMCNIKNKIDQNKEDIRSFIRSDLGEIVLQQINTALIDRFGAPDTNSEGASKQQSTLNTPPDTSLPPPRLTNDTAGNDDPSSGSSTSDSSSSDSSTTSSPPPTLVVKKPKKTSKKSKDATSVPSTVDVSSNCDTSTISKAASLSGNTDKNLKSSQFVNALTETLKLAIPAREIKLTALQKDSKTAYATWKKNLLSTLTVHRDFKSYMKRNTLKGRYISSSLPIEERETLYQAIYKSVADNIRTSYGLDDLQNTDGIKLLAKMEKEFGLLARSTEERVKLTNDLLAISKHQNESFAAYHKRFSSAVRACQLNKVMPFTANDTLYCHYLKKSGEKAFHTIRIDMETSPDTGTAKSWLESKSLEDLKEKCQTFLRTVQQIVGDTSETQSPKKDKPGNSAKSPSQEYNERERKIIGGIKKKSSDVVVTHLRYLQRQRKDGCWLHNTGSHQFLQCGKVEEICKKYQCEECIPLAAEKKQKATANRVSTRKSNSTSKIRKQLKARKDEVSSLKKEMKALRADFKKMKGPRLETVEDGDEVSSASEEEELEFDEDSENESVDHNEVDNSSTNDNNSVTSYIPSSTVATTSRNLKSILLQPNHPKSTRKVTFKSLVGYSKYTNSSSSLPSTSYTVVDSGATEHMDCHRDAFDYIVPVKDEDGKPLYVQQGDGSDLIVEGMGTVTKWINNKIAIHYMSYFIPTLGTALFSVKKHMEYKGCYFHAEDNSAILAFPTVNIELFIEPEILFTSRKYKGIPSNISFNSETAPINRRKLKYLKAKMVKAQDFKSQPAALHSSLPTKSVIFERRHKRATLPFQATPGSIGFDIKPLQSIQLLPKKVTKIPIGLACAIPKGLYARLAEHSSLGVKGVSVQGGVIDPDYRGEIHVLLLNHSDNTILLSQHEHFAQLIFEYAATPMITIATKLPQSQRGEKGLGSTTNSLRARNASFLEAKPITTFTTTKIAGKHRRKARRSARPLSEGLRRPRQQDHYLTEMYSDTYITDNPDENDESPELLPKHPDLDPKSKNQSHPQVPEPRLRPNEKVNPATKAKIHMTKDDLSQSIGFLKPDKFKKNLKSLGDGNFSVSQLERNPKLDPGETASIKAMRRNTKAESPATAYSDLWHMDIGYGPCRSIGGYSHTLLFVDSASRYQYVYPLKNLTTSLLKNVKRFFKDCKTKPKTIRTDFDNTLISGKVAEYIEETQQVDLEAAPPHRQHQNGLVERAWQTIVSMARNWLTSSLLPSKYW